MKRRKMLGLATIATFGMLNSRSSAAPVTNQNMKNRPKLLIFDVNETLLDLKPLEKSVAKALGGKEELVELWFTTMLQYCRP